MEATRLTQRSPVCSPSPSPPPTEAQVPWEKITLQLSLGKSCGKDQRMKPLMVLVLSSVVLLGGCTTAYQPPPGLVWGYTGTSDAISSLRMVVYAQAKSDC